MEFAGFFGHPAEEVKSWLDENGLTVTGTHTGWQEVANDFEKTVAYHKTIGNKNIIVPGADLSTNAAISAFADFANEFQPRLEKEGISLQYHNHHREYFPNKDGQIPLDELAREETGKLFTVHQNRRWDADFLSMKQIYESGSLGPIFNIESRVHGSRGIPGDWRQLPEHGGGMMLDWGVHLLDQALQMIPEKISSVYARMDHITNELVDDGFKMDLTFESGLVYRVEVGTSNCVNLPRWYLQGRDGTAIMPDWELKNGRIVCCENWDEKDVVPVITAAGLTKTMAPRDEKTIAEHAVPQLSPDVHDFYRNVCRAIDGLEPQLVTHPQMMRVMKVMEAAFESDRKGQVIPFDYDK